MWPLYAAGFTTAFGAHAVAANLGGFSEDAVESLLTLGMLLAVYDGAEVLLKPVFGTIADRIGARPVLIAGLVGFALASATYVVADSAGWLWAARLGQGAAASAFSPAASALVSRLNPGSKYGRAFGSYGFYKSIGYTLGPLIGGALVWLGGFRLLFAVMTVLGLAVAGWALLVVPAVPPLPRARQTVLDLVRRVAEPAFLRPTAALAGTMLPGLAGLLPAAVLIGLGTGLITPLAFAALAAHTPQARLGQTMGTAEVGRELGDAGGPLLVAAVATATALAYGYAALAAVLAAGPLVGLLLAVTRRGGGVGGTAAPGP